MSNLYRVFGDYDKDDIVKVILHSGSSVVQCFGMPVQEFDATIRQIAPKDNSFGELARLNQSAEDGDWLPSTSFTLLETSA
jgi:hypothetical protein